MDDLTIRQILASVKQGQLRVPAFQRGFVWDANRVAFLMDSIHKGYPIGSLLIWRTRERLRHERKLGAFALPDPDVDYPVDYILDGQQRITSIFGVFQTDIPAEEDANWMHIYYDLRANADIQESQFLALDNDAVDPSRHFPMDALFDIVAYRRATRDLNDVSAEQIDKIQTIFKEARIPVQMITTENRTTVAIVFERVNQRGVPLDTLQLLTAWTWSQDFHLQRQFDDLASELEPFGFDDVGEDNNLLLRCCSAVIAHNPSTETLINLNGTLVRERFSEVLNGLKGAIDFLQANLNVYSLDNLPYLNLLVPLAVFFASPSNQQIRYDDSSRQTITTWFWRVCFSKRYNSQPVKSLLTDVIEMAKLKSRQRSELGNFAVPEMMPEFFKREVFRANNVNTKTFILLLAQSSPRSFISGSPISLKDVLREYNRNEFHHLYPRAYLKQQGDLPYDQNCLANFCYLSRTDNNTIGGLPPSQYKNRMPSDVSEILDHAVCTGILFDDNFKNFIDDRSIRLAEKANALIR